MQTWVVRVHKQHAMDREIPSSSVLRVGTEIHKQTPFCMQHGGMRVTEYLLQHLQDIAIKESMGRPKKNELVNKFNAALHNHGVSYTIKQKKPEKGQKTGGWYDAKLNGSQALAVTARASYKSPAGERVGWLWDMWKGDHVRDAGPGSWLETLAGTFEQWHEVLMEGRMLKPSPSVVQGFGAKCRTLFRYAPRLDGVAPWSPGRTRPATPFPRCSRVTYERKCWEVLTEPLGDVGAASRRVRLQFTDEGLSYYLHALALHGGELMEHLGSLGKYMNEGMEHHHKHTWILYDHTGKGGTQGNPWVCKTEDGKFDRTGKRRTIQKQFVTAAVMTRQSRVLFNRLYHTWDSQVWHSIGLRRPEADEVRAATTLPPRARAFPPPPLRLMSIAASGAERSITLFSRTKERK